MTRWHRPTGKIFACFGISVFFSLQLNASGDTVDPFEPNDTPATATLVECGFTGDAGIDPLDDEDYYRLEGLPGQSIYIDIDAIELGSELVSAIGYHDSGGNLLEGILAYLPCPGENPSADPCLGGRLLPPDNVLIVGVIHDHFTGHPLTSGPYRISIDCISTQAPDLLEPNNTPTISTPIECPYLNTELSIHNSADVDWYTLTGAPGSLVEIDIDSAAMGEPLNAVLWIADSSLQEILFVDDSSALDETGSADPWATVVMPPDGILNFAIGDAVYSFADYTLEVNCHDRPDIDQDGVPNDEDNCRAVANAAQSDTNVDGIGNRCDMDLDNDCAVNFSDLSVLSAAFFSQAMDPNWNPDADFNSDGIVNFADLSTMAQAFFKPFSPSGIPNPCRICGIAEQGLDPAADFGTPMFVRGSFNDWLASDRFVNQGNGIYQVEFELAAGTHEYKIADNDWTLEYAFPLTQIAIGPTDTPVEFWNFPFGGPDQILYAAEAGCVTWTMETAGAGVPPGSINVTVTHRD